LSHAFDSLLTTSGCETVTEATIAAFTARPGPGMVFLTGDAQHPEAEDVAVVVREFLRSPGGRRVRLGVVERRDERAVMEKLGVLVLPALVLMHDGAIQEIIGRMREWQIYQQAFTRLIGAGATAVPA
jgi:hypothetical protein